MANLHDVDRDRFSLIRKHNMALAERAENELKRQRKEQGRPETPLKIGKLTEIRFKK